MLILVPSTLILQRRELGTKPPSRGCPSTLFKMFKLLILVFPHPDHCLGDGLFFDSYRMPEGGAQGTSASSPGFNGAFAAEAWQIQDGERMS